MRNGLRLFDLEQTDLEQIALALCAAALTAAPVSCRGKTLHICGGTKISEKVDA
jgi:hypothetical protein